MNDKSANGGGQPPSPLNGERLPRTSSRLEPLNPVGTRSTASPSSGLQLGTQWNASLPVPAGRFMGRAGVRGEMSGRFRRNTVLVCPHFALTSPSPLPSLRERSGNADARFSSMLASWQVA
jgi:hypothetical protein